MTTPAMLSNVLALDVGTKRIGVAIADLQLRFAHPLLTIAQDETTVNQLQKLLTDNHTAQLVIGLPRGLDGQETAQTSYVREFAARLEQALAIPIMFQDEAATSIKAEAELRARKKPYEKAAIDALAATYILEDYLVTLPATSGTVGVMTNGV